MKLSLTQPLEFRHPKNIIEMLIQQQKMKGNMNALNFINDSMVVEASFTFDELVERSKAVAYNLVNNLKLKTGDRVLLVYPPSLDFIIAFFGCLMTGIVAVPTYPPDPTKMKKDLRIFHSIKENSGSNIALTSTLYSTALKVVSVKNFFTGEHNGLSDLTWVITDPFIHSTGNPILAENEIFKSTKTDLAFLQYTSGSTSEPKGVMVSHDNVFWNITYMAESFGWDPSKDQNDCLFSWLPQYHDMGLLSYLGPLCNGCKAYIMSPINFIKNPSSWIDGLSTFRVTHCAAPNFSYALVVRKFRERMGDAKWKKRCQSLDLSSLKLFVNAAEPVMKSSMDLFESTFEPYGMKRGVVRPFFGLAEHVIYVSGPGQQIISEKSGKIIGTKHIVVNKKILETEKKAVVVDVDSKINHVEITHDETSDDGQYIRFSSCGNRYTIPEVCRKIVDPETTLECPDGDVGEIWVDSPSKTLGYYNKEILTQLSFQAKVNPSRNGANDVEEKNNSREFLRTGDLGFFHENELYICGRIKDMIIIRGRNHFPQDIERTSESIKYRDSDILRKGCNAAFSVAVSGQEVLVFCAELLDGANNYSIEEYDEIIQLLRREISQLHGVPLSVIFLLTPKSIPKTTSGKIARQWVKKSYLEERLVVRASWSDLDNIQTTESTVGNNEYIANMERIDPTGLDPTLILNELKQLLGYCLERNVDEIQVDVPLLSIGIDSMQSIQLRSLLKKKFTTPLPEIFSLDPDVNLLRLAEALSKGENFKLNPILVNSWDAVTAAIKFSVIAKKSSASMVNSSCLPVQWFNENQIIADSETAKFETNSGQRVVMINILEIITCQFLLFLHNVFFGWISLIIGFGAIVLKIVDMLGYSKLTKVSSIYATATSILLVIPVSTLLLLIFAKTLRFDNFKRHYINVLLQKYFSHRVIMESKAETYENINALFVFTPSGHVCVNSLLTSAMNEFLTGKPLSLHHTSMTLFLYPIAFILSGQYFLPDPMDSKFLTKELSLEKNCHIGIAPGGIEEMYDSSRDSEDKKFETIVVKGRRSFIIAALQSGKPIVPCYCFGSKSVFYTLSMPFSSFFRRIFKAPLITKICWPIPRRVPLVTVIGNPLKFPQIQDPTIEEINDYHEKYLREVRRIYDAYKNIYGWSDRKLILRR